jgi:orotidine-5'-phosphate decarboxylase
MKKENLIHQIKLKKSFLCIGLDTDLNKIPKFLLKEKDPIFEFIKELLMPQISIV